MLTQNQVRQMLKDLPESGKEIDPKVLVLYDELRKKKLVAISRTRDGGFFVARLPPSLDPHTVFPRGG